MKIIEITREEFKFINKKKSIYFQNGVLFNDDTDNVVAFERYESDQTSYYKVDM